MGIDYNKDFYDRLSRATSSFKKNARAGIVISRKLADNDIIKAWEVMLSAIVSGDLNYTYKSVEKELDINVYESKQIVSILSALSDGLSNDIPPEIIVNTIIKSDIAVNDDADTLLRMINFSPKQELIKQTFKVSSLVNETMPSLDKVFTSVDVRFRFEDDNNPIFSAVAIFNFYTDVDNENLVFQASRGKLEELKTIVDGALSKMEKAESIVRSGVDREHS